MIRKGALISCLLLMISLGARLLAAQSNTGTLRIQVLDPSGAAVVTAVVVLKSTSNAVSAAQTNRDGLYEFKNVAPGVYTVEVTAQGFSHFEQKDVEVAAGKTRQIDISLEIEVQQEEVDVEGEAPSLSVDSGNNMSALIIKGEALEALSDDPEDLAADLQALAGPAAGPNGGQIYVERFLRRTPSAEIGNP